MSIRLFKLFLLIVITMVCFVSCTQNNELPEITEQEFAFCIEYSVNNIIFVIDDAIVCKFDGLTNNHGHKSPSTIRKWSQKLKSTNEDYNDVLIVKEYQQKSIFENRTNSCSFVYLSFGRADYYMGESEYQKTSVPCFYYYESFRNQDGTSSAKYTVLTEEQLKEFFSIEIIQFSFQSPVLNTFK